MTSPLPSLEYDAPPVNPAGYGLYDAATIITAENGGLRVGQDVQIRPLNCETAFGTWPADPCEVVDPELRKEGDRVDGADPFEPVVPWAYDECDPQETNTESQSRALQTLRLREPLLVESDFATRLLIDDGAPVVVADIVEAVSALETELGEAGYLGVIHASRRWAAYAAQAQLIVRSGPILRTPLGHTWVFGGGYDAVLGATLVATGSVTVWRGGAVVNTALDPSINRRLSVAERNVVVGYECLVTSVTVTPAP